jgi:hypothetical protein
MKHRYYALAIAPVVGVAVAAGIAVAGTPAADGSITACVNEAGIPRIIDTEAGDTCGESEQAISWTSGWRHRGTYDANQAYAVGDVVSINNRTPLCGAENAVVLARMIGTETLVKTTPGPDTGCPYANGLWRVISYAPNVPSPPSFPGVVRIWLTDDNTANRTSTGIEVQTWNYADGTVWIHLPAEVQHRPVDAKRCTTIATPIRWGNMPGGFVNREYTEYQDWILLRTYAANGQPRELALDVSIDCR